jgi:lipopolysaccharide biosynthesis glycosyltransferase
MVEREGGAISFISVPDSAVASFPTVGFTRKATWYRIYLPDLLPSLDRVLYLDSDLLVTGDLRPLWATGLDGHYLGAVTNVLEPETEHHPAELGIAPDTYFNAGVLLMNLAEMRRDGCTETLRSYSAEHAAELMWRDQDALNAVLGSRRLALHPRWNCMNAVLVLPWARDVFGADAVEEARRDPAIRHFEGRTMNKPWHFLSDRQLRELYFEHRRATPWPRVRREGVTPANFVRRGRRAAEFHLARLRARSRSQT